jgi:hypothetical protein
MGIPDKSTFEIERLEGTLQVTLMSEAGSLEDRKIKISLQIKQADRQGLEVTPESLLVVNAWPEQFSYSSAPQDFLKAVEYELQRVPLKDMNMEYNQPTCTPSLS